MMFNVDKEQSLKAAKQFIYPVLILKYGNHSDIISVEESDTPLARSLDNAGTDILIVANDFVAGVNSRCHKWSDYPKTFTIRQTRHGTPAEYFRIKNNMERGGLTPKFFAQVYYKDDYGEIGFIETEKLFNFVDSDSRVKPRFNGDVKFVAVAWQHLKDLMETYAVKGNEVFKLK